MIRLSKLTDYGILLMTQMARHPERTVHTARDLSAETKLPLPTVSKLLKSLANAELLISHRGVKGGYSFAKVPHEISVAQVIVAMEGPIGVTECGGGVPGMCDREAYCPMLSNWQIISNEVRHALENLTIPDLIYPLPLLSRQQDRLILAMDLTTGRTQ
jgi:FeS assembly SUF system regulator